MNRTMILGAYIAILVGPPVAAADDLIPPLPPLNDECTHQISGATVGFFNDVRQESLFGVTYYVRDTNYRAVGEFSGGEVVSSPVGDVYQYTIIHGYTGRADYCF